MNIQIFGRKSCQDSRKAERFFKERRVAVHFVDLKQKAASKGELRRFVQKFGTQALIDRDSRRFLSLGLHASHYGDDRWLEIMAEEPGILVTPLVRNGNRLTVGADQKEWSGWLDS